MVNYEILLKLKKAIFFTFSFGEMSCMADASLTVKKNQNIRYVAKNAYRLFLTVYVFIFFFNVRDNKGNEKTHCNIQSSIFVDIIRIYIVRCFSW